MELIIRASEKLAIRTELLERESKGLRTALIDKKKRRKARSRWVYSLKTSPGQAVSAMFFSSAKIVAVRGYQEEFKT